MRNQKKRIRAERLDGAGRPETSISFSSHFSVHSASHPSVQPLMHPSVSILSALNDHRLCARNCAKPQEGHLAGSNADAAFKEPIE